MRLPLDTGRLVRAKEVFSRQGAEIALIGRVSPSVCLFINANFAVRLRVFSEERGMRALGRSDRGEVKSLVAGFCEAVGPERFFACLAGLADTVFFDTRVWMAHSHLELSEADRFNSDLGLLEQITNDRLRAFTRAALGAGIPVVLGGHSLVAGGLWALAETIVAESGREPIRPF